MDLIERLRHWCNTVRRKPSPLADAIPMMQQAADALAAKDVENKAMKDALQGWSDEVERLIAENARLTRELANARAVDIHSCHPNCDRAGCVNARLREDVERWAKEANNADDYICAFVSACAFIDSHVADPDITEEMCRTYADFMKWRAAIAAKGTTP